MNAIFDIAVDASQALGLFSFLFVLFQFVDNWNVKSDIRDLEANVYH